MKAAKPLLLLGESIMPGQSLTIKMEIARLHSTTKLKIPVIVVRSRQDGPVVLFTAAVHGDEINGVEIVRQLIVRRLNRPKKGTVICIPVVNMFGFVNQSREFPDGRDLNRVFPGTKNGSLASRFAYHLLREIMPVVDYAVDFHSGGASRFNASQIRIAPEHPELRALASAFNAPFTLLSKNISGSFRNACERLNVRMLLFEGGKSLDINQDSVEDGVAGSRRLLHYLGMLSAVGTDPESTNTIVISRSGWVRAKGSGLFHNQSRVGSFVGKGTVLGLITDPFGKSEKKVKAPYDGYIINANQSPIVYEGDAIYHLSSIHEQ